MKTETLAMQLRSMAAIAPTLHRPALAAAADAVEECARLRAERDAANRAYESIDEHLRNVVEKVMPDLRAERDEARALLSKASITVSVTMGNLGEYTEGRQMLEQLVRRIDAALKEAK